MDNEVEMNVEWEAWSAFCNELKAVTGASSEDLNLSGEYDKLFNTVRAWGEHLVSLRIKQPDEVRAAAFAEHCEGKGL